MIGIDEAGLTDEQVRTARHGYYAAISYVDERIGELLAALHDSGLDDETTVVFTADHGEMLGERGLWYKMSFFEPSARVPLIVTAPGRIAPGRRAEPVSLLDLVPTLLELAGSGPADEELTGEMDGVSLGPLLDGRDAGRPAPVVGEYLAEGVTSPALMIRRGSHKFVSCEGDPDQLYDLSSDPLELVNLAERPPTRSCGASFGRRWRTAGTRLNWLVASSRASASAAWSPRLWAPVGARSGTSSRTSTPPRSTCVTATTCTGSSGAPVWTPADARAPRPLRPRPSRRRPPARRRARAWRPRCR